MNIVLLLRNTCVVIYIVICVLLMRMRYCMRDMVVCTCLYSACMHNV